MTMRRFFCLILSVTILGSMLLFSGAAFAEDADASAWANANLPYDRMPESIEIVPYDELPPVVEGQHHYLLLCIDQWNKPARPADAKPPLQSNGRRRDLYGNTDGMVLVTLDTRAHRIMLTSFIRDAIIQKPSSDESSEKFGRINYVYNDSGPEALCQVISQHIGVRIEKFILFNFGQIQDIVDYLGGVDIDLKYYEINYLHRYRVPRASVVSLDGKHDVYYNGNHPEGIYHFTGHSAVLYMRIRKAGGGGDFMRTQRVRTVLSTLADKCRDISWEDAKALANNIMENNNVTNLNLEEMIDAAGYAFSLRDCTIEELRIPVDGAVRAIGFANMAAQEVNWPVCRAAMADYLQNSFLVIDEEE